MRVSRSISLCVALAFTSLSWGEGVSRVRQEPRAPSRPAASSGVKPKPADEQSQAERRAAFSRVQSFAKQVLAFESRPVKAATLARLADLLWNEDEEYARGLFMKALELSAEGGDARRDEAEALARVRREAVSLIAKRDAKLAKRLTEAGGAAGEPGRAEGVQANFKTANDLLKTQPDKSVEFARRSLGGGGSVPPGLNSYLILLRSKDERAANALFVAALNQLVTAPAVDVEVLQELGTYVFTSPQFLNDPNAAKDMTRMVGVERWLVYDITADRPDVPREIINSYLQAAVSVMTRPDLTAEQKPPLYAFGRLLLPKAEKFNPEMVAYVGAALGALAGGVPPELTQEAAYRNFEAAAPKNADDAVSQIEKEGDAQVRDARYLALVSDYWYAGDFAKARLLAGKISDVGARSDLQTVIDFKEALNLLEREKNVAEVERLAAELSPGVERAVLWLAVSHTHTEAGDHPRAAAAVQKALASFGQTEDARRPFLTLSAAAALARFDAASARERLAEAVKQFNARGRQELAEVLWERRVDAGPLWRYFPLAAKGVRFDLRGNLSALLKADRENTIAAATGLKGEEELSQALLAIASEILKDTPRPAAKAGG